MSYTKFSKEVTKWLKDNGLPCYGTANDSPEETKARLDAWMHGSKEILRQWITEKRYRELISCAHGGWYQDDVIFEPLAEHFVANHLFDELRFLCERGIRFSAEDMLATIKSEKEEHGTLDIETIRSIDVPSYVSGRSYSHLGEIAKYRKRALDQIIRYLCPALRGHIQYFATSYSKSADHEGRAAIRVDGVEVLRSNYYTYFENVWTKFHHLRSTTLKDHDSAKEAINQAHAYALEQGTFDQKVFYEAFGIFDNQSIEKSLVSENPLVRIFALLDRRLGKRRLLALEDSMEQELDWVRAFYVIRLQAEGLMEANNI